MQKCAVLYPAEHFTCNREETCDLELWPHFISMASSCHGLHLYQLWC